MGHDGGLFMRKTILMALFLFCSIIGIAQSNVQSYANRVQSVAKEYVNNNDYYRAIYAYTEGLTELMKAKQEADNMASMEIYAHMLHLGYKRAELCSVYLSDKTLTEELKGKLYRTVMNDCQNLFVYFDLNIELLWGAVKIEQVYFVRALAKLHFGDPTYDEDFKLSGDYGRAMWNFITGK